MHHIFRSIRSFKPLKSAFRPLLSQFKFATILTKNREPEMFCHHCAQTSEGLYCDKVSTCGKTPELSKLQALLLQLNLRISQYINVLNEKCPEIDTLPYNHYLLETTFSTLTNVNFDEGQSMSYIAHLTKVKDELQDICQKKKLTVPTSILSQEFVFKEDLGYLTQEGKKYGVWARYEQEGNPDAFALREFLRYGLKGVSAYFCHAERARSKATGPIEDYSEADRRDIYQGITRGWCKMEEPNQTVEQLFDECMKLGGVNLKVMRALSNAHSAVLGAPEPTKVKTRPVPGPAILVSGHDLVDLKELLEQTKDKGINIYTHGEMTPGLSYPELKKYSHLKGNLGKAWHEQKFDFKKFRGAILVTSNCLMEPRKSYKDRIFTTGSVGWRGIPHLNNGEFGPVIECALKSEPFTQQYIDEHYPADSKDLIVGFGHKTVLGIAGTVIDAIKTGALKNIFLIGGCDGGEAQRKYFTDLAAATPNDSIILTLGCGKYRVNQLQLGELGKSGIPRILDMGQCNDSYSAVVVALELAKALGTEVNKLPLHLAVAWYEQKALAVLLTLLHLNIQNIRVGPIIPAFLTPGITNILVEKFNLQLAHPKDVHGDLQMMLNDNNRA